MHIADTYRSTSDSPNFQNIPVRLPWMAELIRQCFIPRAPNRHIVESDYGGIEVHGASWYHKDPTMLDYLNDKTKDMHRDMAQQCYALSKKEMIAKDKKDAKRIKDIRFCGKNMFVFPEFYGDWWASCAPSLWSAIDQSKLHTRDGMSIKKYLKSKGIKELGIIEYDSRGKLKIPNSDTFLYHIKMVEDYFWNKRFKVYKEWKEDWYEDYLQKGYFDTLTGFRIEGPLSRNKVINYPVQGVAFHCLLWSLIRLQKLLHRYHMKSLIVGQIHDSIVADVIDKELKTYMELIQQVMVDDIKKHWKWIITPIEVEIEMAPAGKSWFFKEKVA
jgi:DNA polymerase I-like protein with 3'-5' exonuclease and polymerase domains